MKLRLIAPAAVIHSSAMAPMPAVQQEEQQQAFETSHLLELPRQPASISNETADGEPITVEEVIERIGFGRFQLGLVTYTGLAWLADAAEMILLSFIGPAARCEWQLSSFGESAISSAVFAGVILGAYCWGLVSDVKGRRLGFLTTALFTFFFGILSAWSPAFWWLLLSRAFVGFGLGGASVVFSLCMEFLPASNRGFWLVFIEFFWTAGSMAEALLAWVIMPNLNWRLLVGLSALPFLLLLIFYPALPESPRYLMVKGDKEGAWKVLQRVAKVNGAPLPSGSLTLSKPSHPVLSDNERQTAAEKGLDGSSTSCQDLRDTQPSEKEGAGATFLLLFSPELKFTTMLLWAIFFANAFTYYGLVLLTTQLPVKSNVVVHEEPYCLPNGKPNILSSSYKEVLITCIAELPGLLVACFIVEKFGRKFSLGVLLFACGAFVLPLWTPLSQTMTTVLMFGSRSCIMGAFSILWAYAPEVYPTEVRSTGLGFANSSGRVGGFLCPFVAVGLVESGHRVLAVALFASVPLVASMASLLFPVETKGKKVADHLR